MSLKDTKKTAISSDSLEKVSGGRDGNAPYVATCQTCGRIFKSEEDKNVHASAYPDHVIVCIGPSLVSIPGQTSTNKPIIA